MPQSSPKQWGPIPAMLTAHPMTCGRPRYMRGTIGWTPSTVDILTDTKGALKSTLNMLYVLFPALFGAKVVVCMTCNELEFVSPMARKLFHLIRKFIPIEEESVLFLDEDVQRIGEFAETLDLEYVGDENG